MSVQFLIFQQMAAKAPKQPKGTEGKVKLTFSEPELLIAISAGTQGGGAIHRITIENLANFERLWGEATPIIVKLANLSPIPTTDLDKKEIAKALEGEPVALNFVTTYKGRQDEIKLGCKFEEVADKMATIGLLIADFMEYEDKRKKALDEV